ncbi:MAG: DNA primase [Endomicrobium sp.]|jgi:DNA primase|nr:DNA primase [Endomicrobium sp.]
MAIVDDIIERIRLSSDIISIIREYLPDLKRAGKNWKACCPFHNEKTPSFVVSPEKGIFRCFGCNVSGDIFKFVMLMDNISWIESVRKLAKKAGIEIKETQADIVKVSEKTKLFEILENSAKFYHRCFLESQQAAKARQYLEKRGINADTIKRFMIGYAPKGQLIEQAAKKGYMPEVLLKAGIITKTERGNFFEYMSERVVFPIFDIQGRVIAFGGRTLNDEQQPKYLNTPETAVYLKSSNLYGLFQTLPELRKERNIIVLEGYMDVIIPYQFGVSGAVASLGTAFTQSHAKLISRYADSVTLLFDADDAGRNAAQRALEILIENDGIGIQCSISSLPEGIDADEYLNENGKDKFLELIEKSSKTAIEFMIDRVSLEINKNIPETKAKAVSVLLNFVLKSGNSIVQREWVKILSQRIGVNEESVWREFKKKQRAKLIKYTHENDAATSIVVKNKKIDLSLEENLINILLTNRNFVEDVSQDDFIDARCARVFGMIASGSSETEILNLLSESDAEWFTELTMSPIEYNDVEEAFRTVLKDINIGKLKKRRHKLEKEILLMTEGKLKTDDKVIKEYKELTIILKGSGK